MFIAETADLPKFLKCGWEPRDEGPRELAARLRDLNLQMAEVEPEWRDLWPLLAARAIKPGRDPGPILDMATEDLASLIDRRARFDPPRYPAPVDPEGYRLLTTVLRNGYDPLEVHVSLSAAYGGAHVNGNELILEPNNRSPIWNDPDRARRLFLGMIFAMNPSWGCVVASLASGPGFRPWMVWSAPGADIPQRYLQAEMLPAEVQPHLGGELRVWD
jgi:hypothetical protein